MTLYNSLLQRLDGLTRELYSPHTGVGFGVIASSKQSEFTPTDVAGILCWLKSTDGITKDGGDLISDWADQSGNSNDIAQGSGSKQPLFIASGQNSLPTVRFDGVDNNINKTTWTSGSESQPNTVFIAMKFSTINDSWAFDGGTASAQNGMQRSGTGTYRITAGTLAGTVSAASTFAQFTLTFNTTSSSIRRNASSVETGLSIGVEEMNGLNLGSLNTGASGFSDVDISEVIVYDSEITGTDLSNLETYLIDRYAL